MIGSYRMTCHFIVILLVDSINLFYNVNTYKLNSITKSNLHHPQNNLGHFHFLQKQCWSKLK